MRADKNEKCFNMGSRNGRFSPIAGEHLPPRWTRIDWKDLDWPWVFHETKCIIKWQILHKKISFTPTEGEQQWYVLLSTCIHAVQIMTLQPLDRLQTPEEILHLRSSNCTRFLPCVWTHPVYACVCAQQRFDSLTLDLAGSLVSNTYTRLVQLLFSNTFRLRETLYWLALAEMPFCVEQSDREFDAAIPNGP